MKAQQLCVLLALLASCVRAADVGATTEKFSGGFVAWPDVLDGLEALIPENASPANFQCSAPLAAVAATDSRTCQGGVLWSKTVGSNGYTDCACYAPNAPATVTYDFDILMWIEKLWLVQYGSGTNHVVSSVSIETSTDSVTFTEVASATSVQGGVFGRTIVTLDTTVQAKSVRVSMTKPSPNPYGPCVCSMQLYGAPELPVGVADLLDVAPQSGNIGDLTVASLNVDWSPALPPIQGNLTQDLLDSVEFSITPTLPGVDTPDLTFDTSTGRIAGTAPASVFDGRHFNVTASAWWSQADSTAQVVFASNYTLVTAAVEAQCTQFLESAQAQEVEKPSSKAANAAWCQARNFE